MMLEFWKPNQGQTNIYLTSVLTADRLTKTCKFDVSFILTKQRSRRFMGKHGSNGWESRLSPNQGISGTTQQDITSHISKWSTVYPYIPCIWTVRGNSTTLLPAPHPAVPNPEAINCKRISWVKDCCIESVPTPKAWLSQRKASKGAIVTSPPGGF